MGCKVRNFVIAKAIQNANRDGLLLRVWHSPLCRGTLELNHWVILRPADWVDELISQIRATDFVLKARGRRTVHFHSVTGYFQGSELRLRMIQTEGRSREQG